MTMIMAINGVFARWIKVWKIRRRMPNLHSGKVERMRVRKSSERIDCIDPSQLSTKEKNPEKGPLRDHLKMEGM